MAFRDPFATAAARGTAQAVSYDAGLRAYMLRIYNYMASGLALTGITAMVLAKYSIATDVATGQLMLTGLGQSLLTGATPWVLLFGTLGLVMWLSFGIHKMRASTAQAIFWFYSALMGAALTPVFLMYTGESIARAFFVSAGMFGAMSLYGYTTKKDLSGVGSFLFMGLIGLILASLVNLFLQSSALAFAVSVAGVVIFVGLTAWDTQRLKELYYQVSGHGETLAKVSIMGALTLYLDFVNMFLFLLRFLGDRR